MNQTPKPSICFVAHNALGALCGGQAGHIGGVERQTSLMAKWFAANGFTTSLITWDDPPRDVQQRDGVNVVRICKSEDGLPGLRFFHPRWTSLVRALARANADVYYQNGAEAITGQVSFWCRSKNRRFVFSAASEADVRLELPAFRSQRDRWLYRQGLKHASLLIVQSQTQQKLLKDGFNRDSVVLPMPCAFPARDPNMIEDVPPRRVAWIGRVDTMKRMEWVLEIAKRIPEVTFDIVAANMEIAQRYPHLANYARELYAAAASIENVHWHGAVAREQVGDLLAKSLCLCCTSTHEGFPNTFLEAWSQGRPVVSSFDPDGLIRLNTLGDHTSTIEEFVTAIKRMLSNNDEWRRRSQLCLQYYQANHTLDTAMQRFQAVLTGVRAESPSPLSYDVARV